MTSRILLLLNLIRGWVHHHVILKLGFKFKHAVQRTKKSKRIEWYLSGSASALLFCLEYKGKPFYILYYDLIVWIEKQNITYFLKTEIPYTIYDIIVSPITMTNIESCIKYFLTLLRVSLPLQNRGGYGWVNYLKCISMV